MSATTERFQERQASSGTGVRKGPAGTDSGEEALPKELDSLVQLVHALKTRFQAEASWRGELEAELERVRDEAALRIDQSDKKSALLEKRRVEVEARAQQLELALGRTRLELQGQALDTARCRDEMKRLQDLVLSQQKGMVQARADFENLRRVYQERESRYQSAIARFQKELQAKGKELAESKAAKDQAVADSRSFIDDIDELQNEKKDMARMNATLMNEVRRLRQSLSDLRSERTC